jgi:hypothetical protein
MDYKFLLECKNDLFNFLSSMLINPIYLGIRGMYEYSFKMHNTLEEKCKSNNKLVNPGIASILRLCLNDITSLNNYEIENIYNDIKQQSGCYNYFDDLVRACFKSYILLLTYNPVTENSKFSSPELYENIIVKDFIHKCYIEVSNYFKDNLELIIKDRKKEINHIIKDCIEHSIKKSISNYDEIIKEYLKIKFDISKKEDKMSYDNIKNMVNKMIDTQKYGQVGAVVGGAVVGGSEGMGESSFNNVENFINANKELDAIVKNSYIDGSGGGSGDSAKQLYGNNYILNTQSNEHSTTIQLQEGTSNIINVGLNKDREIDDILNNKLAPINEEELLEFGIKVQEQQPIKAQEQQPIKVQEQQPINVQEQQSIKVQEQQPIKAQEQQPIKVQEQQPIKAQEQQPIKAQEQQPIKVQEQIFQKSGGVEVSVTSTDIIGALETTSVNNDTVTDIVGTNKTSLLESPMPIRNNKINDILPTVKKGRPPKNRPADKFFNELV